MKNERQARRGWATAAAEFLAGLAVILLFLALARQHDVWFGRSPVTVQAGIAFFALWALVGIGLASFIKAGQASAAAVCLATAMAALFPLYCPTLLARSWEALLLAPQGVVYKPALTALCWRTALRLAVPGLAAGWLAADSCRAPDVGQWWRATLFVAGGAAGALVFRPLLATLGFAPLLCLVASVAAVAAVAHLVATHTRGWRARIGYLAVAGVLLAAGWRQAPQPLLANGVFGRWAAAGSAFAGGRDILFHRDGAQVSATVYQDHDYGRVLTIDGRPVAFQNRFKANRILAAHIPLLLAPRVGCVVFFGEEAPLWASSARAYAPVRLVCRGADAVVGDAAHLFAAVPVKEADGMDAGSGGAAYDVLHVVTGPAWMRQGRRALTESAFQRYARVMTADGVVAVSLDGRSLSPAAFQTTVARFARVWPHAQLWCTGLDRWLLVGSRSPLTVPLDRLLARFETAAVFQDILTAGVTSLPELLSACVLDEDGIRAYVANQSKRRREGALEALFARDNARRVQASVEPYRSLQCDWIRDGAAAEVAETLRKRVATMLAVRGVVVTQLTLSGSDTAVPPALHAAAEINPRDLLLRELAERVELEAVRRLVFGDARGALKRFEEMLVIRPDDPVTHYWLSLANQRLGQRDAAFWHSGRATALAPQTAAFRLQFAAAALQAEMHDEAKRQYREALILDAKNIAAKIALARLLGDKRIAGTDLPAAVKLAEEAFRETGQRDGVVGYALADLYIESGRVFEGVALKRTLKKALRTTSSSRL